MRALRKSLLGMVFFTSIQMLLVGQTTQEVINQVNQDSLIHTVSQFSGEDSCIVNGTQVLIKHRVSSRGNNLAADYLAERLRGYGLSVEELNYRPGGRNIVATQIGKTFPDSIYLIGAHYDAVADFCADDNASGSGAVLEAARILSQYCVDYTIKYAFWDEEERGLIGSDYYADTAKAYQLPILGAINLDMMGYDGNGDKIFDIHTNNLPANLQLKDTVLFILDSFKINLVPQILNPGTNRSDHASFWRNGYPAILFGESVLGGDPNPEYHKSTDRLALFDTSYYFKLAQLGIGTLAQLSGIIPATEVRDTLVACDSFYYSNAWYVESGIYVDSLKTSQGYDSIYTFDLSIINTNDSVEQSVNSLRSYQFGAQYQWLDCDMNYVPISGATTQLFEVPSSGNYAVEVTNGRCVDTSKCFNVQYVGVESLKLSGVSVYPNPTDGLAKVDFGRMLNNVRYAVYSSTGSMVENGKLDQAMA
jgi:hypothetical protein